MYFLCLELVNSSWYITHKTFADPLFNQDWLMKLADKWGIRQLPAPTEAEINDIKELRNSLGMLLRKMVNHEALCDNDLALLNNYMSKSTYYRKLEKNSDVLKVLDIPISRNWNWFMAEAAASFAKLYTSLTAYSLKACQNPECGWFFIDESKSGTRKWCDDTCATLMKVRRFRQKQKEKGNS